MENPETDTIDKAEFPPQYKFNFQSISLRQPTIGSSTSVEFLES